MLTAKVNEAETALLGMYIGGYKREKKNCRK
jgi:hypothetical protein